MTDDEIKRQLLELLDFALEGVNQSCCNPEVTSIDKERGRCTVELDLVIVEEDEYVGFEGY